MAKNKVCRNSAEIESKNGDITFIAARNVENLNGWTYDVKSLQAQNEDGDYAVLTNEAMQVSIPLMVDHSGSVQDKIGTIDEAHIETVDEIDQVVMHANFFDTEEAQNIRQRILDSQLTDVSITTDWGTSNEDVLENSHIIEVSVVYAGAEPKAKILVKNSFENGEEEIENNDLSDEQLDKIAEKVADKLKSNETYEVKKTEEVEDKDPEEGEEEEEMAEQKTNKSDEYVATKAMVLNALSKLAQNNSIKGMNRSQVIEAVKNEVSILESDGTTAYVVPDAIFTEILAINKPTDILDTFKTMPVKRFTLMSEKKDDTTLARAGKYTKGELKLIQTSDLLAQKFGTEFLYKLQEISYEDMQEDFGNILLQFIRTELPQKVTEEEERDYIVGDGRESNDKRHITSIVSLDAAAEDATNVHVYDYDGSSDASSIEAVMNGITKIGEEGTLYAVMNKTTLNAYRQLGLASAAGLPFSEETVAGALGVNRIFTREYVATDIVYVYTGEYVKRLTGGSTGESIEQYDIDYNNRKIEFIRPVGGAASGLYSAVKIALPGSISA